MLGKSDRNSGMMSGTAYFMRGALLATLVVVALAAIVALDLPSADAQSEEQRYGKITARRVADDRIEFGWQPTDASGEAIGARVFPRARFLPQGAPRDRWLSSSPVEVEGEEIGRINARAGGRIEFGFTPTDGERILPPARYFPHNAERGRWLSSTTIMLPQSDAPGPFSAVSAGGAHTCVTYEDGTITCWGLNSYGQSDAPEGSFTAVSAGGAHTCGLRESGEITCWGSNRRRDGDYVGQNLEQNWGTEYAGQIDAPEGSFTAVSAGGNHTCGLRESGEIACWGEGRSGETSPPPGRFRAVSAGTWHACGLRTDGSIECWGSNDDEGFTSSGKDGGYAGQADAPPGRFTAVSAATTHSCGLHTDGSIECWGQPRIVLPAR